MRSPGDAIQGPFLAQSLPPSHNCLSLHDGMVCVFCHVPEEWGDVLVPPGVELVRDSSDLPAFVSGEIGVFCLDGLAASAGWLVVSDHICVFGTNPLVERNLYLGRIEFPNLRGMYLVPPSFPSGVVLGVPSLVFSTGAELRAFRASALVELSSFAPVLRAGASGVSVCVLLRCRGVDGERVSSAAPLVELFSSITGGGEEQ